MGKEQATNVPLAERPIPEIPSVAGWKDIPIIEPHNPERLVPLGAFSENGIYTSSVYFGEHDKSPYPEGHLEGSMLTVFVREGVSQQLQKAEKNLPDGMRLVVFDAYRSLDVQGSLYKQYFNALKKEHPDWDEGQLSTETQKYVSLPASPTLNPETKFVSPHNTGGAVDLGIFKLPEDVEKQVKEIEEKVAKLDTSGDKEAWKESYDLQMEKAGLIKDNMQMLDFGTPFDFGGEEAALNYLEELAKKQPLSPSEKEALGNRRILYYTMKSAGFEAYGDEWWHYNSNKAQMGAKTAGLDHAEYGSISLSSKNKEHEEMRRGNRKGTLRIQEGVGSQGPDVPDALFKTAQSGAGKTSNLRLINLPNAEKIEPRKKAS